jgi:hypothetical protein
MVIPQQVQYSVYHKTGNFIVESTTGFLSLFIGLLSADNDIAEYRYLRRLVVCERPGSLQGDLYIEREYICRFVDPPVRFIELLYLLIPHEENAQFSLWLL